MPLKVSRDNYYDGITSPVPNTAPIYPKVPIDARCRLVGQVTDLNPEAGDIEPVFLFRASEAGAIIELIESLSIILPTSGGGGGGGSSGTPSFADGPVGLGDPNTAGSLVVIRFYSVKEGDQTYWLEYELPLDQDDRRSFHVPQLPILPAGQNAWRLAPFEEIYVGLNRAIPSPGINVFLRGGHYS